MSDTPPSPFPLPPSASPSPAEADLSGRQLGDFHLLRRLGRGAMADVYLADQARLKRRVAMKILRPELAGDRTYLQRFQLEAQAAASLVHANIVQIYEVGCVDQLHYIAQEYVPGQNLQEYITRHGPPDLPHALSIMRQVAAALGQGGRAGRGPPRHQAREHHAHRRRRGEGGRLRPGTPDPRRRRQRPDPSGHHAGHAALHEPGAGRRQAAWIRGATSIRSA